ncbi:MAG TPA: hypothetical protein PLV92_29435, partial [Pirellulaceae bacterium]|nr:hypothetical protein [Pirellulaceae bacterium]
MNTFTSGIARNAPISRRLFGPLTVGAASLAASFAATLVATFTVATAVADGPADNQTDKVRRLPKLGVEVPADRRAELEAGLAKLAKSLDQVKERNDAKTRELWPDVAIYHKAVHDALVYQEFHQ